MRSVSIVGVGCTPFKDFEEHPETQGIGEGEAFGYAALEAIADAGLEPRDIDFFYHGSANPYLVGDCITPNMQVADWFGVRAKGSVHHSEACCTGYVALEQAVMAVASGAYDVVLTGACDLASTLPVEHMPSHIRQDFTLDVMIPSIRFMTALMVVRSTAPLACRSTTGSTSIRCSTTLPPIRSMMP